MKGPVLLNFKQKKALVIGYGTTGKRRAKTLMEYGCSVTVLDPKAECAEKNIQFEKSNYAVHYLKGMFVVIAATDDKVLNRQILTDCQERGILCNAVSEPEESDFIFPSVVRRGDLTLSVCTDGASPALTKSIKRELENRYDQTYEQRTALLKILRQYVLKKASDTDNKQDYLEKISKLSIEELQKEVEKI